MKEKLLSLDLEDVSPLTVGLIRMASIVSPCQFFYEVNQRNSFKFRRMENLVVPFDGISYEFLCMQGYDRKEMSCVQFLANNSFTEHIETPHSLFDSYEQQHLLMENMADVDYLLVIKNEFADFSLILLPENRIFPIQPFEISPEEKIYHYIEENE